MRFARTVWIAVTLALVASLPGLAKPLDRADAARVTAIVRYVMGDRRIDGMAVGVAHGGAAVFARGYGFSDRRRTARTTAATVFPIASLTKSFTAAALRTIVDRHDLSLREPLGTFVPHYVRARNVTLDQLLAQTSGVPDYAQLPSFQRSSREPVSPDALLARVEALPLAPGGFAYSNTNYLLAAIVVQRIAGEPYAEYLQRTLLHPLALRHTHVALAFAHGALRAEGSAALGSPTLAFGCADLASNVFDLMRWTNALFGSGRLPVPRTGTPYDDGFYTGVLAGRSARFANGYVAGYSAFLAYLPSDRVTLVILSNADLVDLAPLAKSILAIVLHVPDAAS